ncbi:hypothetical protein B4168_3309 [Anoxybacillus flavithermus]|nr:hypothetical protein B4168_3309 [Anoxybacillus flavithermus]OAO85119.1 hypothetical protein GT23_3173 [Parageobacillus thermoglucosidasius]
MQELPSVADHFSFTGAGFEKRALSKKKSSCMASGIFLVRG